MRRVAMFTVIRVICRNRLNGTASYKSLSTANQQCKELKNTQKNLPPKVITFIEESMKLCQPESIHICDGSKEEEIFLLNLMKKEKTITPLSKYENCWLARTNPNDVARVESKTFLCTSDKKDAIPEPRKGVKGTLGNWMSREDMEKAIADRFPNSMKGKIMYVIPFSMGPVDSPLSKFGIEITDSPYVVISMKIMTRMGRQVLRKISEDVDTPIVRALHSVGAPADSKHAYPNWPCDPERTIILHDLENEKIVSYGSGYGGNSLLGKKCFALRIGSYIARKEGWLAEHMLILGITNPAGKKRYIAAAFPSACGKTNLAMMTPTLPGYKVECVGDDIAWMKFNDEGELRAINPENGFFGVAPGTSSKTNPNAMKTIFKNTIFTNVASTSDGGVYWDGLDDEIREGTQITDWLGNKWQPGYPNPAAHPNSRFCSPASQCPIIDGEWENPKGVRIDAILFGGRRPEGIPLVYESLDWNHGVFVGASMRSETTAAAEHKGKVIMHDPFAMRPFFGYNFGQYVKHWMNFGEKPGLHLPKIFHVNWFRKDANGKFLWPGFGENSRVLDWIFRRLEGEPEIAEENAIGFIPKPNSLNVNGLKEVNFDELFKVDKSFWEKEVVEIEKYFLDQLPTDIPKELLSEVEKLKMRLKKD